jgi:hypothetical protein
MCLKTSYNYDTSKCFTKLPSICLALSRSERYLRFAAFVLLFSWSVELDAYEIVYGFVQYTRKQQGSLRVSLEKVCHHH